MNNHTQYYQDTKPDSPYYERQAADAGRRLKARMGEQAYAVWVGRHPCQDFRDYYYTICAELDRLNGRR